MGLPGADRLQWNDPEPRQLAQRRRQCGAMVRPPTKLPVLADPKAGGSVTIKPDIISPDNDGLDDFAGINYQFPALRVISCQYVRL